jgi:hypothetical protein
LQVWPDVPGVDCRHIVLTIVLGLSGISCAHRHAALLPLAPPPAPLHEPGENDATNRANEASDRLRRQQRAQTSSPRSAQPAEAHPTDAGATLSTHPTGTSWSVVIRSSPATQPHAPAPQTAGDGNATPDELSEPSPHPSSLRAIDVVGGSVAAICGALALRKRARKPSALTT